MSQPIVLHKTTIDTPIGEMVALTNSEGLYLLEFTDKSNIDLRLDDIAQSLNATISEEADTVGIQLENELYSYFEGKLQHFTIPVKTVGTDFQIKVWEELVKVPFGEVISYKQQAISIGRPQSVRAVANANGANHIAIVIPCHRIIGSNGKLTGYSGGLWRKKELIKLEQKFSSQSQNLF